jgi:predicted ATP-grasp superfamily ATP-dependent carboligase
VKIFVYEHITGGGCLDAPLPDALLQEAMLMVRALVTDLSDIEAMQVIGLRDRRLAAGSLPADWTAVRSHSHRQARIDELIRASDATWPIAPETGGILEDISRRVLSAGRPLLGSRPEGVHVAASKLATALFLQRAGVPVVPTVRPEDRSEAAGRAWIAKPDDGCGCEDVRFFAGHPAALRWIDERADAQRYVLQPYIPGEPLSLSVLARDGRALLLSVNRQRIAVHAGSFLYRGSVVNALPDTGGRFRKLAQDIVAAIPGLWGYFGVDLILAASGPVVVDVNPRLTTSYAGLRPALGVNAAGMVLAALSGNDFGAPSLAPGRPVVVDPSGPAARGAAGRTTECSLSPCGRGWG